MMQNIYLYYAVIPLLINLSLEKYITSIITWQKNNDEQLYPRM
jgi:hypothetical protein